MRNPKAVLISAIEFRPDTPNRVRWIWTFSLQTKGSDLENKLNKVGVPQWDTLFVIQFIGSCQ